MNDNKRPDEYDDRELFDTASLLGDIYEEEPPASLRASILDQIAVTPQLPADEVRDENDADDDREPAMAGGSTPQPVGRAEAAAQRRWFSKPISVTLLAAASVAAIVGVVFGANWPGANGWGAQQEFNTIQAASDAVETTVAMESGAEVTVHWSAELGQAAISVDGMEAPEPGKTYELWFITEEGATPAGTFVPGDDGATWRVLEGESGPVTTVGITVEPEGGSEQPTTDPILLVEL
ncbi:anti-sigma factor [Humidisolicoccus flavus]|uniref:anti-sigma factor n=1 Tax=Humidisolicoccus flavus TaxID=3111414 RepID=UPI00324BCBA7